MKKVERGYTLCEIIGHVLKSFSPSVTGVGFCEKVFLNFFKKIISKNVT